MLSGERAPKYATYAARLGLQPSQPIKRQSKIDSHNEARHPHPVPLQHLLVGPRPRRTLQGILWSFRFGASKVLFRECNLGVGLAYTSIQDIHWSGVRILVECSVRGPFFPPNFKNKFPSECHARLGLFHARNSEALEPRSLCSCC